MISMPLKKLAFIKNEDEKNILLALYKYYLNDITFERAAEDAHIPIYFLVSYVNDNNLPIVHTDLDVTEGVQKVVHLMVKRGMNVSKLKIPA